MRAPSRSNTSTEPQPGSWREIRAPPNLIPRSSLAPSLGPERSTGVQPSGPESKAGEGKVHAVHREQLDGRTMEHSVSRPARHEGTTAARCGGNAM